MYIFSPFKWNVRAVLQPPIKLPWVCVDTRFFLLSKASFHFNAINFSNALHLPLQSAHILRRCLEKADAHEAITAQREMSTRSLKWKKHEKFKLHFARGNRASLIVFTVPVVRINNRRVRKSNHGKNLWKDEICTKKWIRKQSKTKRNEISASKCGLSVFLYHAAQLGKHKRWK